MKNNYEYSLSIVVLAGAKAVLELHCWRRKKEFLFFVSDKNKIQQKYIDVLKHSEIDFEDNGHTEDLILSADEIIKSPGIPDNVSLIKSVKTNNIPVISEIEFATRHTSAKLICITGSNGKTTTTLLLYHILKTSGINVGIAGNIGSSFAKQVAENDYDVFVLEISSFQLDGMFNVRANIAILLNITPDHLDRYDNNFDKYIESKFRIIQNQTSGDVAYLLLRRPCDNTKVKASGS